MVGDNVPQPQVMPIRDALRLADEMELDLIEISPKAEPPVCRIADYQKFLYQQKKKARLSVGYVTADGGGNLLKLCWRFVYCDGHSG